MRNCWLLLLLLGAALPGVAAAAPPVVKVGSKKFTESVILADMACLLVRDAGGQAEHRKELGGTQFLWQALLKGDIDLYPEYTGTLSKDIFRGRTDLKAALAEKGLRMSRSLGFSDSYGLGMRADVARRLGIRTISDLRDHPDLKYGLTEEFKKRDDGWSPLKRRYGLDVPPDRVRTLDHDLATRALKNGDIDVTDLYTTEGAIRLYDLVVLEDDLHFFPLYEAVWVYRADLPERQPESVLTSLLRLEGKVSTAEMTELNALAMTKQAREVRLAAAFLKRKFALVAKVEEENLAHELLRLTGQHLFLVAVSLAAAVLVAIPLGIVAARRPRLGQVILGAVSVLQTVPSLAMLAVVIPLLGIGWKPAVLALFIYSLLPIVRNTYAGLHDVPGSLRESARALGLPPAAILRLVELPLASRTILAGIKTAAVINVGTATLGALVGAGGYGQPILTGIRLDDPGFILEGAIPAALLALLVQGLFELAERFLCPRGLRLRPE